MYFIENNIPILHTKDFAKVCMTLYANNIMHIRLKRSLELLTLEDLIEIYDWVETLGTGKYLNLFEGNLNTADVSVRNFISDKEQNKHTIADAVFVERLSEKMVADFYLNNNNPVKPTKVFTDRTAAINWLLIQSRH